MAKKYIFANSAAYNGSLYNLPKGVTVLEFDTETNSLGIYNDKKAIAAIPVQPEKDNDNNFEIPKIPEKLSELQNDKAFITLKDVQGKLNNIVIPTKLSAFENDKKFISTSEAEAKFALKSDSTSFLQEITYDEINKVLSFIFKLSDGTLTTQDISISDLVDIYTAGDNIKIEGNKISFIGNIPDVSEFITISDVNNTLTDYALKSELPTLPDLTIYALKEQIPSIPTKLSAFQNDTDYTAYEVYANDTEIPSGKSDILGDIVNTAIPANMTDSMRIRTSVPKDQLDVIVDWGDGTTTYAIDFQIKEENIESKDYDYIAKHTYTVSGKYIVKIYGKKYYGISHSGCDTLMCRAFDVDLPIASCVQNFTFFCGQAPRLLNVHLPEYVPYLNVRNWSSCFNGSINLRNAIGFERITPYMISCANIFNDCYSLIHTDFRLPIFGSISMAFRDCQSLTDKIQDLQPLANFARGQNLNINFIFNNCKALQGTITPQKWWNDKDIIWSGTRRAFTGCTNITNFEDIPTTTTGSSTAQKDANSDALWNN